MQDYCFTDDNFTEEQIEKSLKKWYKKLNDIPDNLLIIPPDSTRSYSYAGLIVNIIYKLLPKDTNIDIMPALGTHRPMSKNEINNMYGTKIPKEKFLVHNWRKDVIEIGKIPKEYIFQVSEGLLNFSIQVNINKNIIRGDYDLILSIGQVVPHEVVGMANYNKNIFVGCGGKDMINKTHYLSAVYGMEKILGKDKTPVRKVFDYADKHFLNDVSIQYILTVTTKAEDKSRLHGLFIGEERETFEKAVNLSKKKNITRISDAPDKILVYLSPEKFKSTWLGNKAIYRTRLAIKNDGDLIIIAPGLNKFGEDKELDKLIRKYGYIGKNKIMSIIKNNEETILEENLAAAAHLIHGSSEKRFNIYYSPGYLSKQEIESVNYSYKPIDEINYNLSKLKKGYNFIDGEKIYFIDNPALGLWMS